ncbi:MAG TPA: hypothetical protein VNN08_00700, partial [Thermoanaerobaculia bacterium]|nr:hypothetical protein [Thermoanaerobaculia bacterium]
AISKSASETAMFSKISFGTSSVVPDGKTLTERARNSDGFSAIDDNALGLIREKRESLHESADALERVVESFRRTLTADTLQNEYTLRPTIHRFFVENPGLTFAELNERVYTEVFKTPREDPWLGLRSDQTFTALAGEGVEQRRDTLPGR